ncbi:MAG: CoA transferase [Chloroflexi bacterium]|nr:CoA transferase [Chloroflexota bacterium]
MFALEGVKVLDLSSYVAGPYAGTILADLGADVIRVESLEGDTYRYGLIYGGFLAWNRGKRSLAVDLTKPAGQRILHQLVPGADILMQNFRPAVAQKLGVDYDTVRALNPRIIYYAGSGYGQSGPYSAKPGFDPLLQARSGIMRAAGGEGDPRGVGGTPITDVVCAMSAAWGMALALLARARTGQGQLLEASLLNAAVAAQAGEMVFYAGKPPPRPRLPGNLGYSAGERLYQTAAGWLYVECTAPEHWQALGRLTGAGIPHQRPPEGSEGDALAQTALEAAFRSRPAREWYALLLEGGVPCAPVQDMDTLYTDSGVLANGAFVEHQHPVSGLLKQLGMMVQLAETPGTLRGPAPELGQHTDEILRAVGYGDAQIASLREQHVVR